MARRQFHHKNIFTIILIILSITTDSNAYLDNLNVPCKYLDSINITNGIKNTDDSIMFEGITYPKTLHATYDYEFTNESYRHSVVPHERGCICAMNPEKPCVRMCCPRGKHLKPSWGGSVCAANEGVFNISVSVYEGDTIVEQGNIFDFFNYVWGKPCVGMSKLDPDQNKKFDTWKLLKSGHILKGDPLTETLNKNQYCFTALPTNDNFKIALMTCFEPLDVTKDYWVLCGMFLSVPFLLATIVVYIILPELRNLHGKSLVCYLCGLVVGYTTLGLIKLNGADYVEPKLCRTMGYATYCGFMSAFFWLNVISFDLWRSFWVAFRSRRSNDSKKFFHYSAYAWGSTALMLSICLVIDYSPSVPTDFQPAIGIRDCFLGNSIWSQLLYLYLPIMIIMIINLIFFVLTYWKIRIAQIEMAKYTNKEESKVHRKNLETEKSNHGLFLRMFIVMGVTWSMDPISWLISPQGIYFYLTDVVNAIQGVIIFFLFVFRVNVKNLMVKRWHTWRGKEERRRRVTTTVNSYTGVTTVDDNDNMELQRTSDNVNK